MSSSRERLVKLLTAAVPEWRGRQIVWKPEAIYPCKGFWRIRRTEMDVQSWQATAFLADKPTQVWFTVGCWETITECLKAKRVGLSDEMNVQTIYPDPVEKELS
jgi:hypothetical protein